MAHLPVIVGFGGVNPAGRSSGHHGYRRLVADKLSAEHRATTYASLAALMNLDPGTPDEEYINRHTLIRKIESHLFDPDAIGINKSAKLKPGNVPITFKTRANQLPAHLPAGWLVEENGQEVTVTVAAGDLEVYFPDKRTSRVNSAGQLPSGFKPDSLYQARSHPRGLQLTVYGASDAINSLGIPWDTIRSKVPADRISVYASSAMGQLDSNGSGLMLQAPFLGKRVSSKNLALGLAEMTADFVNAYILGSVGCTGANVGACATFLYNLRQGVEDIRSGKYRVSVVGASEAPVTPEVIEGYRTMGALAEDQALNALDGTDGPTDHTRACRPFSDNCGFTLSESSQFVILMDDELALELGANIYGAVGDVFINADGFKKSIPGPGIGNYVTMGKALGVVRSILGEDAVRHHTYVQAHGTGTPQNRVTESHIISTLASEFSIESWPVTAIKAYLGHSLAVASGDQLTVSLGVWQDGLIPGIRTIDHIAEDVHQRHVNFLMQHHEIAPDSMQAVLINAKGFGGNNATAALLSPYVTMDMLKRRHGADALTTHARRNADVAETTAAYNTATTAGDNATIYNFGVGVIQGEELEISDQHIRIPGQPLDIDLTVPNPYDDMV